MVCVRKTLPEGSGALLPNESALQRADHDAFHEILLNKGIEDQHGNAGYYDEAVFQEVI